MSGFISIWRSHCSAQQPTKCTTIGSAEYKADWSAHRTTFNVPKCATDWPAFFFANCCANLAVRTTIYATHINSFWATYGSTFGLSYGNTDHSSNQCAYFGSFLCAYGYPYASAYGTANWSAIFNSLGAALKSAIWCTF
jgi:hypothetical protein